MTAQSPQILRLKRKWMSPLVRKCFKLGKIHLQTSQKAPSELPLDVVIPLAPKDLVVAPFCISALRRNLRHPIRRIFIIAPLDNGISCLCRDLDCEFVNELEILPEGPAYYRKYFENTGWQRANWMYQQFLKLSVGQQIGLDHFLVYDSDTVLINPFQYEIAQEHVLEFNDGYVHELDSLHYRLLPDVRLQPFSFVCHAMLMRTCFVESMLKRIEELRGKKWRDAIMDAIDVETNMCFSEYELYGNYVSRDASEQKTKKVYWYNKSLRRRDINRFDEMVRQYGNRFRTLSFHSHQK